MTLTQHLLTWLRDLAADALGLDARIRSIVAGTLAPAAARHEPHDEQAPVESALSDTVAMVARFVAARCVLEPGARSTVRDLHTAYLVWCASDPNAREMPVVWFGRCLSSLGYQMASRSHNHPTARRGLRLLVDGGAR